MGNRVGKCISFLVVFVTLSVWSAATALSQTLSLDDQVAGDIGDRVTFTLSIDYPASESRGIQDVTIDVGFDQTVLTYDGHTRGSLVENWPVFDVDNFQEGQLRVAGLAFTSGDGLQPGDSGAIVQLRFSVNAMVDATLTIFAQYDLATFDTRNGQFRFESHTCHPGGDIDQNGSVTAADALLAFQHALSLTQLDMCQRSIADVFPQPAAPDGNITASDALCIFQKALSLPSCLDGAPPSNQTPVVNAGLDQFVYENEMVTLSGSGSDADGTIVRYRWVQTSGPTVVLLGAATPNASFTAPEVDSDERLVFELTVTDDGAASGMDAVTVTVRAAPVSSGLREMVFANPGPGRPSYVIAGDNASLQYWMDPSGTVQQSLYESADGTQRVRTFYDEATDRPRTVLNEVSGHWLSIREAGPDRVDFWAYDGDGSYLGGFAVYEKSGEYYMGEIVGIPAHEWNQITGQLHPTDGSWTGSFTLTGDTEDGLMNIQVVPPELAELIDGLSTSGPIVAQADPDRQADGKSSSLHNRLSKGGLALVAIGVGVALIPGGQVIGGKLALVGAGAFLVAQVLPDISEGIRQKYGSHCPPEGSFFGETCADLTNMAGDHLSRQGTGPIGYVRDAMDWIKEAPSRLRDNVANGLRKLKEVVTGPVDNVRGKGNERTSLIGPRTVESDVGGTATTGPDGRVTQVVGTIDTSGNFRVSGSNVMISGRSSNGVVTGGNFRVGTTQGMVSGRIRPPVVTRDIPEQTLIEGKALTLNLSSYFTHPDGLALTYEVTCSSITATTTPQVSVSQTGQLTLLPDTVGASTCTAWAYPLQERLWRVSSTFLTKVAPSTTIPPPVVDQVIPDQSLPVGEGLTLNLTSYFSHPDGLELHFDTASSDDAIATADVIVDLLLLQAWEVGTLSITVSASVGNGPSTTQHFTLTVTPFMPKPAGEFCKEDEQARWKFTPVPECPAGLYEVTACCHAPRHPLCPSEVPNCPGYAPPRRCHPEIAPELPRLPCP